MPVTIILNKVFLTILTIIQTIFSLKNIKYLGGLHKPEIAQGETIHINGGLVVGFHL